MMFLIMIMKIAMAKTEKQMFERAFVEWKDQYVEYCKNSKSPHYKQYYVDTHGEMGVRYLWLWLDDLYAHWLFNVKNKEK